jgi:hypothetical protein
MLESIMVEEVVPGKTIENMELKIKHFLTEFDILDQQVKTVGTKPKIIASFNFICLPNLLELTRRFGPLRNLWEGGFKGEGFIVPCKKFLQFGQRPGFEFNALKNRLTEMALQRAASGLTERKSVRVSRGMTWPMALAAWSGNFKRYKDPSMVVKLLLGRNPVSVVLCSLNDATVAFAVIENGMIIRLEHRISGTVKKMGSQYSEWKTQQTIPAHELSRFAQPYQARICFGVLLPLFDTEEALPHKHTFVRSMRYGV